MSNMHVAVLGIYYTLIISYMLLWISLIHYYKIYLMILIVYPLIECHFLYAVIKAFSKFTQLTLVIFDYGQ